LKKGEEEKWEEKERKRKEKEERKGREREREAFEKFRKQIRVSIIITHSQIPVLA
jgi:hypothetical protein